MNAVLCAAAKRGFETQTIIPQVYARVGAQAQVRHCPFCDAVVYSRRNPLCGVCAKALPEEILFDAEQSQNVRSILHEERQRHRAWLHRFNFAN